MLDLTRRALLGVSSALMLAPVAARAAEFMATKDHVPLWPGKVPGDIGSDIKRRIDPRAGDDAHPDRWIYGVARPELVVFRPQQPNGSAVLCIPGGSYEFVAFDNEGAEQARWLTARGVTVFVLLYRLPAEGWARREDVPLQDAQRAMRVIRRDAAKYGIDPKRVAALGFSAGGHLCGDLATRFDAKVYDPVDAADRLSARPAIAAPIYAVQSMSAPLTHGVSHDQLLGPNPSPETERAHSPSHNVSAATPPCFLAHAEDDGLVPVENTVQISVLIVTSRKLELFSTTA